ncbi:MAG: zinc ribbon domain-containing protein [candidate division Zixibacteria bacterium]|nr:zinc ribbon domain-containing protein [candidate division Zixibacteria bacterium]MDH3936266.1 zinc ribbon domain-containing protein [candidate division Zixibacteria bacterium]
MPTYVYRCNDCGHEFEEFQSITEKPLEVCPTCKGQVQRVISGGAGFLFKGSGFYQTDYRSDSYKKAAAADKGGGVKSESSSDSSKSSTGSSTSDSKATKPSDKKKPSSE